MIHLALLAIKPVVLPPSATAPGQLANLITLVADNVAVEDYLTAQSDEAQWFATAYANEVAAEEAQAAQQAAEQQAAAQQATHYYQPSAPTTTTTQPTATSGNSFLNCVVQHESGGNPTAYNPSGASGLFQDMPGTWNNYDGYPTAASAPASVQWQFNEQLYASQGTQPWAGDPCVS